MLEAYIYDGLRTPFGRHAGALAPVRPDDLLGGVIKALMARSGFLADRIDDVQVGCTNQAGEDARNVARHALLLAGLPIETPGVVHNRLCGSGLNAEFGADTMPETADNMARDLQLSRADCDRFAYGSQAKFEAARARGFFEGEIGPIRIAQGKGKQDVVVSADEHPRPQTTLDDLARLRPLFEGGVTTAGNSSGINDGAAALVVGSRGAGERAGCKPIARIVATAVAGVAPRIMGYGPVPAVRKALERGGLGGEGMGNIGVDEAFAAQVLGCLKGLDVAFDDSRVNPNGGAIAVGHPLGASGARLALTVARQLQETGGRYAAVSMCIGVGQGIAVILERV